MMENEAIELLRSMQNPKQDYADVVCAPAFCTGFRFVYPEPEDYAIEEAIKALKEIQQYREIGTVEDFERLAYLKKRYEDETYDYCGEYGASKCELKDRVEKLQEYEAIGTVEECRAAVEKQKPKKPEDVEYDYSYFICPVCGDGIYVSDDYEIHKFCRNCGQAIDWSEEE